VHLAVKQVFGRTLERVQLKDKPSRRSPVHPTRHAQISVRDFGRHETAGRHRAARVAAAPRVLLLDEPSARSMP